MAKGSVRKKGKKWYCRFYVENEIGNLVQKEYVGTENKRETEAMLRKAMEDYDAKQFIAKSDNITLAELLDLWVEEYLKPGDLSNGTVSTYTATVNRIKQAPIAQRKLKSITPDNLQSYVDELSFGTKKPDGTVIKGKSKSRMLSYSTVLREAFRFAVFPKRLISVDPMQYVVIHKEKNEYALFCDENFGAMTAPTISHEQYLSLVEYLSKKKPAAKLPIQIAYYTGLRLGEVAGLTWQDINLNEQYLTVRRSVHYSVTRSKLEVGPTKRNKIRVVDFGNALTDILIAAKKEQQRNCSKYKELYRLHYYKQVQEKNRVYYEICSLTAEEQPPTNYKGISFVCLHPDGSLETPQYISYICRTMRGKLPGMENFHFHMLRHTYTSNLLFGGASPKDVQELLGHSDVNITMNVYAHSSRDARRSSAKLLDKVAEYS